MDYKEICRKAIEKFGIVSQIGMMHEEMCELGVALEHWKRDRCQEEDVVTEIADVMIVAAHEYANCENPTCPCEECLIKTFKAGAEWMAGQGVRLNAVVNNFGEVAILNYPNEDDNISRLIADNFEQGDKVVVQIRKK